MSAYLELAEKVEAASGPDRVLDGDIACAIGLLHPLDFITATSSVPPAPAYTASLDAAMAPVPEGWVPTITLHHDCATAMLADDCVHPVRLDSVEVEANSGPLALTAAALRARHAQEATNVR